jgi:hypothetical protein
MIRMSLNDAAAYPVPEWSLPLYQDMVRFRDAQLVTIGDSHALFFAGTPQKMAATDTPDLFAPHIRTITVGPALAWNLTVHDSSQLGRERTLAALCGLRDHDYKGWVMLSFGAIDLHAHVTRHALESGLITAVTNIANRYLAFIDEARQIYPQLAIWGVPGATPDERVPIFEYFYGKVATNGSEIDRNFCVMLFNRYLEKHLTEKKIPFLTVHDMVIQPDGRTRPDYLYDGNHLHRDFLPYVFDLLEARLGITVPRQIEHSNYAVENLHIFRDLENTHIPSGQIIDFEFACDFYVDALVFGSVTDCKIDRIEFSLDRAVDAPVTKLLAEDVSCSPAGCVIPLNAWVRKIALRFVSENFIAKEIRLVGRLGYFSRVFNQGLGRPIAMRTAVERLIP